MKRVLLLMTVALMSVGVLFAQETKKSNKETVIFNVEIDCDGCVNKIMKNIAFEKGVRDLLIDKDKQQVTVVYNPKKTDEQKLREAFAKIGKPVHDKPLHPAQHHDHAGHQH